QSRTSRWRNCQLTGVSLQSIDLSSRFAAKTHTHFRDPQVAFRGHFMLADSTTFTHLKRGTSAYRRATLALFCAGFATFAMLYCVQPLLPLLASHFSVSAASSSL